MCGRFTIAVSVGWPDRFQVNEPSPPIQPRYNIAPSQMVPIIIHQSPNRIVMMQWGLVPFWAKDPKIGSQLINARAETLVERPAFRTSLKKYRCLVPAAGFYEWKKTNRGKIPYYLRLKDHSLFAFAGLYDRWKSPDGHELMTFTIITTEPNSLAGEIHNRMPVMLLREHESRWLRTEPLSPDELGEVLTSYPAEGMESYPVSSAVNVPSHDGEELIRPVGIS